jgi:glycosyltransferase involved in cell wall biosynthesis
MTFAMPYLYRFTIVVPCWNAADTLRETLASLESQTFGNWQALLIDDGSTDATPTLIAEAAARDPRFRALRNTGKGPSAARNLALHEARGEILSFCDADDLFDPTKLARMDATFQDASVAAAYGRIAFFDGARSRTQSSVPSEDLSVQMLLGENPVCTMSNVCVRSSVFAVTGGFDPEIVHNEDLEWLIRLVAEGHRVIGLDTLLVYYRTCTQGLSADLRAMRAGRAAAVKAAGHYGYAPSPAQEAIYLRYLARRALRTNAPPSVALRLAVAGVLKSPLGFFSDPFRGGATALAAVVALILPRPVRALLFAA